MAWSAAAALRAVSNGSGNPPKKKPRRRTPNHHKNQEATKMAPNLKNKVPAPHRPQKTVPDLTPQKVSTDTKGKEGSDNPEITTRNWR